MPASSKYPYLTDACQFELIQACRHGTLEVVIDLTENGLKRDEELQPELIRNVQLADIPIIRWLMDKRERGDAGPAVCNSRAMREAAKHGHLEIVRYFLEECPPEGRVKYPTVCNEALCSAAGSGHLNVVRYIVEHCPLRNRIDVAYKSNRPLRLASNGGYLEVVRYLAIAGYGIHFSDESNRISDLDSCLNQNPEETAAVHNARHALISILHKQGIPQEEWLEAFRRFLGNGDCRRFLSVTQDSLSYEDLCKKYEESTAFANHCRQSLLRQI